jgi:aspartate 1-decarboxylase
MQRHMLKSKIHRATVTACDPDYIGSVTIDADLMRQADLLPNEQVHVWDIDNGARMVTYAIEGRPAGSGRMQINGAAARLVKAGDKVIVVSYGLYSQGDLDTYSPIVVHVDERNRMVGVDSNPAALLSGLEQRWSDEVPGALGAASDSLGAEGLR